jgi:formate dehydrogenase subunit gamma
MGIERRGGLERHGRRARLLHAAVYLLTLPLLITGWWLLLGGEGHPSPLSTLTGVADTRLHVWFGRVLAVVVLLTIVLGRRAIASFARETFRRDPGDARWWRRWPVGAITGRFARHEGAFDPGQRVANVVIVGGLVVLTVTGFAMTVLHGGPVFARLDRIHRIATIAVTPVLLGHIAIALGILPGYRGVWRSMHLGGRVPESTSRRIWPGWTERALREAYGNDRDPTKQPESRSRSGS